jgi:predicted ATPase|uniref:AAA domain-containing protein n=1 Tax=Siphoviridae sp. cttFh17 TaxID=2826491 RepID=A0A8S5NJK7_9CAUD|nr:MAG TPA: hypothetical protein [Siphoviridae sp. cttFh17]
MSTFKTQLPAYFETQTLNLTPLTVLTGCNNTGKTTILQQCRSQYSSAQYFKWNECSIALADIEHNIMINSVIILEQPECALHPILQLEIADKIIELMNRSQITIVETHSDHIINRLTRRYIEGVITDEDMTIYHLIKENSKTKIDHVPIDKEKGIYYEKPSFFYQTIEETEAILNAGFNNYINRCAEIENK